MNLALDASADRIHVVDALPEFLAGSLACMPLAMLPSPSSSACSSPRAGVSLGTINHPTAAAGVVDCQAGLELGLPPAGAKATQGGRVLPPIRLGLPFGTVLGEDSIWLVPPSPTAAETHAAHTLSAGCRHVPAPSSAATAAVVGAGVGQARAPAKRPRTAATANEVREQVRRDNAAKRLRVASPAPALAPTSAPPLPTLASVLLAALHQQWEAEDAEEDDLEFQSPNAAQPCHSAASSAAPPPPHTAVLHHGPPDAHLLVPIDTAVVSPLPYAIAERHIQSFASKLGWRVVGPEVALQPLY